MSNLAPYFSALQFKVVADKVELDFSQVMQLFAENAELYPAESMLDLDSFVRKFEYDSTLPLDWLRLASSLLDSMAEIEVAEFHRLLALLPTTKSPIRYGSSDNDQFVGGALNDTFIAGAGDDSLNGGTGSNRLYGGAGNDVLKVNGNARDNVLAGGSGDDTLYGSFYSDTYLFNLGDGVDTLYERANGYAHTDVLRFGEGISPEDIQAGESAATWSSRMSMEAIRSSSKVYSIPVARLPASTTMP